ncbi:MAG: TolC family protein, partial [Paramuribaculum sp.]|nr:TolC family protein [Paramuribaculum sp.]
MKFMRYTLIPVVALALWICSACSATRECRPVNLDIPSTIVGYSDTTSIADINWWTFYGDSVLTALIQKTLDNNREFMAAAANVERLRQLYGVAKAELLPSIGGNAYAQRETSQYAGESFSGDPEVGIKAQLNWEADLWGSLRWGAKENHAAYAASVEDWRA